MEKYIDFSKKLGRGSFGSVKLVQRISDKKLLAMKVIELAGEEIAKTACNEANILEKLQHPNIVKFYETFVMKESLYLVMEYCDEGDLQKKIKEAQTKGEYFSEQQVLEWFVQVCLAVKMLHDNNVIHRDIKVHNTFLTSNGLVKLGDFGISKQLEGTGDMGKTWLGTPFYVSPEMLSHVISSKKSDIWMLGCLLHELCSLEKPFTGDNFVTVTNKILKEEYTPVPDHYSELIHDLVARLLEKQADKRPSIDEILDISEIKEEVKKLRVKYPESYKDEPYLSSLKVQPMQESLCNLGSTRPTLGRSNSDEVSSKKPLSLEKEIHKGTNIIKDNISLISTTWDLPESPQDFQQGVRGLKKDALKPPLPDSSLIKRKSNNIRALVEQKKNTLSPSNANMTPTSNHSFTSIASSLHTPTSTQQSLIKPVRILSGNSDEIEPLNDETKTVRVKERQSEGHKHEQDEEASPATKILEGSKKPNLSINIPAGLEQNENHSQVKVRKEKPKPATLKSPLNEIIEPNAVSTTKVGAKKGFHFSKYLFDHKSPMSPNRSFWVSQFLKQKLGDEKFECVKDLLENNGNPTQLLKENPERVLEVIGEENRDCLMMLSFLISHNANSVTPTGETKVLIDKSPYPICGTHSKSTRSYRSPHSANPFLKNIFPCTTEPDSVGSQGTLDDIRSTRRIVSDVVLIKEKGGSPSSINFPENVGENN